MNPTDKKLILICGSLIAVALLGLGGALLIRQRTQSALQATTPTPEASAAARAEAKPAITGTDGLINLGLTSHQVDALKYALRDYNTKSHRNLDSISIQSDTVATILHDRTSPGPDYLTWKGQFNDHISYSAKLQYQGLTAIQLWLYQPEGTQVYDSGPVDLYR